MKIFWLSRQSIVIRLLAVYFGTFLANYWLTENRLSTVNRLTIDWKSSINRLLAEGPTIDCPSSNKRLLVNRLQGSLTTESLSWNVKSTRRYWQLTENNLNNIGYQYRFTGFSLWPMQILSSLSLSLLFLYSFYALFTLLEFFERTTNKGERGENLHRS